jgi:hypothetical protein
MGLGELFALSGTAVLCGAVEGQSTYRVFALRLRSDEMHFFSPLNANILYP